MINELNILANDVNDVYDQFDQWHGETTKSDGLIGSSYWRYGIFAAISEYDDGYMESRCQKRCLISHNDRCHFYFYFSGYCQLGSFNTYTSSYMQGGFSDSYVFNMKKIRKYFGTK